MASWMAITLAAFVTLHFCQNRLLTSTKDVDLDTEQIEQESSPLRVRFLKLQ